VEELPVIEQLRSLVPNDVRLMVDAWGAYPLPDAVRVGRFLQDLGVTWFEEPASPYANYAGYETLTASLDIAVAGGEMGRTVGEFKHWFDRGALDIVQPDIAICGGLRSAAAVADLGRLYGIPCVPHTWNGAVMAAATLQLIATLTVPSHVDQFADPPLEYDTSENPFMRCVVRDPPKLVDGYFDVPSQPGLGIEIDEDARGVRMAFAVAVGRRESRPRSTVTLEAQPSAMRKPMQSNRESVGSS
jgi:D-galactarolactone cycloisomerase